MIDYSIAVMGTKPGTVKANIKETKAYGVSQMRKTISFDDFCAHIAEHNSPFSKGTIKGILTDACACLKELMMDSNKVEFGDLGKFYVELNTTGAVTTEDFTTANIKAVRPTWNRSKSFDPQTLRKEASFRLVAKRSQQEDAVKVIKNTDTIHGLE